MPQTIWVGTHSVLETDSWKLKSAEKREFRLKELLHTTIDLSWQPLCIGDRLLKTDTSPMVTSTAGLSQTVQMAGTESSLLQWGHWCCWAQWIHLLPQLLAVKPVHRRRVGVGEGGKGWEKKNQALLQKSLLHAVMFGDIFSSCVLLALIFIRNV